MAFSVQKAAALSADGYGFPIKFQSSSPQSVPPGLPKLVVEIALE